ncbi:MAG: FAD-binding protein [Negativicutes bacterium]
MLLKSYETDVLVIGGGGAGLRAALAAAEAGSAVMIVNKGPVSRSGITLTAAGGMQAPFRKEDSVEQYYQDTLRCGYGLGEPRLARILAEGACEAALDLERYGARFVRNDDDTFALGKFPGQSQPRNLFVKGGGIGIVAALNKACRANGSIRIVDDFFVTGLVKGESAGNPVVAGATGLDLRSGEFAWIRASAVILATGGCQWLWAVNDCPADATGEGLAYAYHAGASLIDMEMVLFYPSVIVWPPSLKGAFVHYEFLAEAILDGNVYDKNGRPVLPKPLPVRDQAMRLMDSAIREGRGDIHGGLLWHVGDSPKGNAAVQKKLNIAQYNYIKSHGVDPSTAKIEVAPGAHYLMGGIHINEQCQTTLEGLFATPECAGNFDGANRLAGSGIASTQVFGARAGRHAHQWGMEHGKAEIDPASVEEEKARIFRRMAPHSDAGIDTGKAGVKVLRDRLRAAVQRYAGVSREQEGLALLMQEACTIKQELSAQQIPEQRIYNQALVDLLQLESMCDVAMLVAGSAQLRTESRGHHFRSDFPRQDDVNWLQHTCVKKVGEGPGFGCKPIGLC